MPNNVGPGKLDKVGVTSGIAEHPAVVPELVALTEVVLDDPPLRFVVVLPCCPFVGELPHLIVQCVEHLGRHHTPVIGGPPLMIGLSLAMTAAEFDPRRTRISNASLCRSRLMAALLGLISSLEP